MRQFDRDCYFSHGNERDDCIYKKFAGFYQSDNSKGTLT